MLSNKIVIFNKIINKNTDADINKKRYKLKGKINCKTKGKTKYTKKYHKHFYGGSLLQASKTQQTKQTQQTYKIPNISFTVEYTGLGLVKPNTDLTGKSQFYNTQPIIKLQNANNKLQSQSQSQTQLQLTNKIYLITMIDPDAPNGIENKVNNKTYTHWVAILDSINIGQIKKTFVKYMPPTPPKGKHRYIFNLYDISDYKNNLQYFNMGNVGNVGMTSLGNTRLTYYTNKLLPLIKLKKKFIYSNTYYVNSN